MATQRFQPPFRDPAAVFGGRTRRVSPPVLLLVALCLLTTAALLLEKGLNTPVTSRAVVWGGVALTAYTFGLLFVVLAILGRGRGPGSWRLGPWMLIWVGFMYGLGTTVGITYPQILLPDVLRALWLVAAGMTMWTAGYLLGPGALARKAAVRFFGGSSKRFTGDVRGPMTPWLLCGIGAFAQVVETTSSSRLGYVGAAASAVSATDWYSHILGLLSSCGVLGVAAAALRVFRQGMTGERATLVILFLAELSYALVSGLKGNFVIAIMAVAIPYTAARNRLPKVLLTVVAIIFLVVVIPFTQAYRDSARNGTAMLSVGQAVDAAPQLLGETLRNETDLATGVQQSVTYILKRGQYIDSPAIILQLTPSAIAYSPADQLITAPLSELVPRVLWPGKPILASGYEFGQQYLGFAATVYSSSALTPFGDLYRYGGWLPVLVGMLLVGCGMRLLDDVIKVRANPHTAFLPLLLFPGLVMAEQDWASLIADTVLFVLLWRLIVALTFRTKQQVSP